ncbi:transcriptional regulator, GntR family [Mizugakiibacter sediminis]|uniref:Transcriptional regulator, GntR family n=2 Tax=Mizugakiibacter sediminis TaxID=1475481 RepID=A0A0K8QKR1_9GAMM|nr:PLP-dependent aminotransferase family protein [Mizugakiibacter sediminis]GAP65072.1 transcriptional regulator, GntR family [Mizugakiibacter sediminis]
MDPALAFPLALPPRGSGALLRALHGQLRAAILDGRLQPGLRLPTTRALAAAYGISRNTAVAAYDLLLGEGYLLTRPRAGVYVADVLPAAAARKPAAQAAGIDRRLAAPWRRPALRPHAAPAVPPRWHFDLGVPDTRAFPFDVWRRLAARALRAAAKRPPAYLEPQGQPALRAAIARHVAFARAVACGADDIVVTAGAQQAFDLLARILVTPGRTVVAVENPGYPPARAAFAAAGARLVPVAVDAEGLVVERLPDAARVICVTPSHQFPLGVAMSARRRAELLAFARRRGAVVIEDDYDGEFRYAGRPLDALQTLDRDAAVFYVGTFSKCLYPALRLGFVAAPTWARQALVAAKLAADWHCPGATQDTLAAFIGEGHLVRHVRRMRGVYAARREALLAGLDGELSHWLRPLPAVAGLHLAARTAPGVDADALARRARELGVGVQSLRDYRLGRGGVAGLVFGFGQIDAAAIPEGLAQLRRACRA